MLRRNEKKIYVICVINRRRSVPCMYMVDNIRLQREKESKRWSERETHTKREREREKREREREIIKIVEVIKICKSVIFSYGSGN